jgi:alginate O-acetyltransferase complex protein AlgJ
MQILLRSARYVLPVVFFSYAAVFNLGYARFPEAEDVPLDGSALRGALTAKLDSVYRQSLPHREEAIGVIGALRYLAVGEGRKGVVAGRDGWLYTAEEIRPTPKDLSLALDRIAWVRDRFAEVGATLVIVPVPGKLDVHVAHSDPETAANIVGIYDAFLKGLQVRDVPVLDARAALRTEAREGLAYFRTDTHWTPAGARAVAEALAGSGLVEQGTTVFAVTGTTVDHFTGDLVTYVTSDGLAPLLGLPPEVATLYIAVADTTGSGEIDIFADTAAGATLLIGTSYSANPAWSFAEALKLALGRDVLNLAVEGQGPVRPMMDYLGSADFREAPPELLIWEFPVRYLGDPTIWGDQGPDEGREEQNGA